MDKKIATIRLEVEAYIHDVIEIDATNAYITKVKLQLSTFRTKKRLNLRNSS